MRILADVRLLSRGGSSGIEEYTRNILRELLSIDKNNEYSFFYNGLRKEPLEFLTDKGKIATPTVSTRRDSRLAMTDRFARNDTDSSRSAIHNSRFMIHDWHVPNKLLDFSARFLNFPAIDRLIKADLV